MMLTSPSQCRDHAIDWFEYFQTRRSAEIASMVTTEIIEEHRRNSDQSQGHHSPELHLILNFLRLAPIIGKEFVLAETPYETFRIGRVTARYSHPEVISEETFGSELEAIHQVFLKRLKKIGVNV